MDVQLDLIDQMNTSFDELRSIFEEVLKMKNASNRVSDGFKEIQKKASILFVFIKKLNRMAKYKVRDGRDELNREKVRVDTTRLQLQNLLYEVNHLKREISYCHQFRSEDEDIELLPDEEGTIGEASVLTPAEKHAKYLKRLENEIELRKQLSAECEELMVLKQQAYSNIVSKMERISYFAPLLDSLLKATEPLQEILQVPLSQEWKLQQLVQLLPQPLYLAFAKLYALEKSDHQLSVTVIGEEDDVHKVELEAQSELQYNVNKSELSGQCSKERLLKPHPLTVRLSIGNVNSSMEILVVNMFYFQEFGFATASPLINVNSTDSTLGEIHSSKDILKYLFKDDIGDTIPVIGSKVKLDTIEMTEKECLEHLEENGFGRPYFWLQKICCIGFANMTQSRQNEVKIENIVSKTITRLQDVWNSHLSLNKQISALMNKNLYMHLKDEQLPLAQPTCCLVQWSSITWEEYAAASCTASYIKCDLVDDSHYLYRAVVVRGSAKMECLISISRDFPTEAPLWVISVYWNGQHNAVNSVAMKSMEYWTNSVTHDELKNKLALLSFQLVRTMYSFDIFLETESPLYSPQEYSREKHYLKPFSKRMRARPYRYVPGDTTSSFKQ